MLAFVIAGCAQVPLKDESAAYEQQRTRLLELDHWSLNGRFAIRYHDEGGSGIIRWIRKGDDYDLRLYDALGRMQLRLWRESGRVSMQSREGELPDSESAEQLMQSQLGWSLPITALDHWVRGLEDPDLPLEAHQVDGLYVQSLSQAQWQIAYSRHELVDGLWVPGMIRIEGRDISLKLIVETWNLS